MGTIHGMLADFEMKERGLLDLDDTTGYNTFVTADWMEAGTLVEVILFLLRLQLGYGADLSDFTDAARVYLGMPIMDMPEGKPRELIDLYYSLLNKRGE